MRGNYQLLIRRLMPRTLLRKRAVIVGILMLGCMVLFYLFLQITTIRAIDVSGATATVVIDKEKIPTNLLLFPTEKVRRQLMMDYPQFENIYIEKKYPSTLLITLVPRKPIAIVQTPYRSVKIGMDGVILEDSSDDNLPKIVLSKPLEMGKKIEHKSIITSLAFLGGMTQDGDIKRITVEENDSLTVTTSDITVLLSEKRDGKESARTLQSLITGFRIKGSIPKMIDLRFDQPVVSW